MRAPAVQAHQRRGRWGRRAASAACNGGARDEHGGRSGLCMRVWDCSEQRVATSAVGAVAAAVALGCRHAHGHIAAGGAQARTCRVTSVQMLSCLSFRTCASLSSMKPAWSPASVVHLAQGRHERSVGCSHRTVVPCMTQPVSSADPCNGRDAPTCCELQDRLRPTHRQNDGTRWQLL